MLDDAVAWVPGTDRVVRGAVALLGVASLGFAAYALVSIASFLAREPESAAEAHAMAHSIPGVLVAGLIGVGGGSVVGVALLAVAYVDYPRLSAATLVVVGLGGLYFLGIQPDDPIVLIGVALIVLGSFALYVDTEDRETFGYVVGVTAWLWLLEFLFIALFLVDRWWVVPMFLPFGVYVLLRWLLNAAALATLASLGWFHAHGRPVPHAPVTLAASVLLFWIYERTAASALSTFSIGGLDPVGWLLAIVATGAAAAILHPRSAAAVRAVA